MNPDKNMMSSKKERFGWYTYDWANSAFSATVVTLFFGPYITSITKSAADSSGNISILGMNIYFGSYFAYLLSVSVILQILILPIAGAIADKGNLKKHFLVLFAYLGALTTTCMFFIEGSNYLFGGILFVLSNLFFGSSIVMYNAYLIDIAKPEMRDSVSSVGWAFGYVGGGLLLLLNLLLLQSADAIHISTSLAVRISLASAGIWWALFSFIPAFTLKVRQSNVKIEKGLNLKEGTKKLIQTIKDIRKYPVTLMFLIAYLFYNDGVQSVIAISSQFGAQELKIPVSMLTQIILVVQFVAFFGALFFNLITKVISTKNTIILTVIIWILTILIIYFFVYSISGFYILAMLVAIVMGGTQALSRSMYSRLIPEGSEAEYFSLYEVSERGTSWMGPLVFALSLDLTHSYRTAILSLLLFFVVGLVFLFRVKEK